MLGAQGFFFSSGIYHWNQVELLEVNLIKLWGLPYDWGCPALLTLRVVDTEPSICQLQLRFSGLCTSFCGGCHSSASAPVNCELLFFMLASELIIFGVPFYLLSLAMIIL